MNETGPQTGRSHGGPVVPSRGCSGCGKLVDPLRAGHVAVLHDQFLYFCNWFCREDYLAREPGSIRSQHTVAPLHLPTLVQPGDFEGREAPDRLPTHAFPETAHGEETGRLDARASFERERRSEAGVDEAPKPVRTPHSDIDTALLLSATVAGVSAMALALLGTSSLLLTIRLTIVCVATGLLVTRAFVIPSDVADPHPSVVLAPTLVAAAVAVWARIAHDPIADEASVLTALVVVSTGTSHQLVENLRRQSGVSLAHIQAVLEAPARRVVPSGYAIVAASNLRPGEEIVVDAGEMVPADVMISAGEATVLPWLDASASVRKSPGGALVAGARLLSGRVRATVAWTGLDRAWLRASQDPARSPHVVAPIVQGARRVVEHGALAAAGLAGLAAFANDARPLNIMLAAIAGYVVLASLATSAIPSTHLLRAVLASLERGVSYHSAHAWDRAAQVTAVVFCARGTLLIGEPQVAEILCLGDVKPEMLLSLAAGAELAASGPIACAVLHETRARGVRADAVRSPNVIPGLGVTAVTSGGQALCVGSRALMLREHVSIALIEGRVAELESLGRTVLLVAVGAKLVGMVALQDGLRPGARASIQYLLDAGIEPVLLSGDSRETCEAIARSLDIEHVRPEVLPSDRASEIGRISESGAVVAVIGRPSADENALGAADVAVALEAAGSTPGEWSIALAGDDVRDAVHAVVAARRARNHARTALTISLAPGILASLAIAFGFFPAAYGPLAVLLGAVAAHLHARAVDVDREQRRGG